MANVAIVTDSTSDLHPSVRQQWGLEVVPLNVHFGEEVFQDGVTIGPEEFYPKVLQSAQHPSTSAPAAGQFLEVYKRLHEEGKSILSVHISSKLSATVQSATMAKEMLPEAEIEIVDSQSTSLGLGMTALAAAAKARAGEDLAAVAAEARRVAGKVHILFGVDTLEFLQRGGRIGKAQAFIGGLLGFKPLLTIDDGLVAPADRVRGKSKVLPRILELMEQRVPAGTALKVAVWHAMAEEEARRWADAIAARYQVDEVAFGVIGPVVGTHTGPGALGVCFYES